MTACCRQERPISRIVSLDIPAVRIRSICDRRNRARLTLKLEIRKNPVSFIIYFFYFASSFLSLGAYLPLSIRVAEKSRHLGTAFAGKVLESCEGGSQGLGDGSRVDFESEKALFHGERANPKCLSRYHRLNAFLRGPTAFCSSCLTSKAGGCSCGLD